VGLPVRRFHTELLLLASRPVRTGLSLVGGVLAASLIGLAVFSVMASFGGPDDRQRVCRDRVSGPDEEEPPAEREIVIDDALAAEWQIRWEIYTGHINAGEVASIVFDESSVNSRADQFIASEGIPLDKVFVCFHNGEAEARATANNPILGGIPLLGDVTDTDVRATGRIDLSGSHPRINITEVEAGSLPGFATWIVERDLESVINRRLNRLTLPHAFDVTFREAEVEISPGR
jgi:hypothetical protein